MKGKHALRPRGEHEVQWQRYAVQQAMLAALALRREGRWLARKGDNADNIRRAAIKVSELYGSIGWPLSMGSVLKYWYEPSDPPEQAPTESKGRGIPVTIKVAARLLCIQREYVAPQPVLEWYQRHLGEGGEPLLHPFDIARAYVKARL